MAQLTKDPALGPLLANFGLPDEPFASYADLAIHSGRELTQDEFCRSFGIEIRLLQLFQASFRLEQHGRNSGWRDPGLSNTAPNTAVITAQDLSNLFAQRRTSGETASGETGSVARDIWIAMGTHGLWGGHVEKQVHQLRGSDGVVTWREFMRFYFKDMEAVDLFSRSVALAMVEQQQERTDLQGAVARRIPSAADDAELQQLLHDQPKLKDKVKKSSIAAALDADEALMDALEEGIDPSEWYTWYTDLEGSDAMGIRAVPDQFVSVDDFVSSYASLRSAAGA